MIGTRNVIAHGYDYIDYAKLWDAVDVNLPRLLSEVQRTITVLGG